MIFYGFSDQEASNTTVLCWCPVILPVWAADQPVVTLTLHNLRLGSGQSQRSTVKPASLSIPPFKKIIRPNVHSHSGNFVPLRHTSSSLMRPDVPKLVEQWSIDQNVTAMSTELCSPHVRVSRSKIPNPMLLIEAPHSATAPQWKMSKMLSNFFTLSCPTLKNIWLLF